MSDIPILLIPILFYCIPALCGAGCVLFFFKQKFDSGVFAILILPVCVWAAGIVFFGGKSMANFLIEPLILAAAVIVLVIAFSALSKWSKFGAKSLKTGLAVGGVLRAIGVILFFPEMPE